MTKRTAISLPDELFREIERARNRRHMDRSTWLQEAAGEYLKHKSKEQEIDDYFAAYERAPLTEDEIALGRWMDEHAVELLEDADARPARQRPVNTKTGKKRR